MPKLAKQMRSQVEEAEVSTGFKPLKPGKYLATLKEVVAKNSTAGNPMWVAEFEDITSLDGEKQPGRQWYNMNLPTTPEKPDNYEKSQEKWEQYQGLCAGRIKGFFEAFGYSVDSDTDELVGEKVILQIGVRTIQNGPRTGEETNQVNNVESAEGHEFDESAASAPAKDGDEF